MVKHRALNRYVKAPPTKTGPSQDLGGAGFNGICASACIMRSAGDLRMPTHDLRGFADEVARLAALNGAPAGYLPTYGRSEDFARPHIEFDGTQFHFVVVERGQELERVSSTDPLEILYHVFESV